MQLLTDHGVPNVAKVASKDQARPVLTCCYLDVDRGVLEATDSCKLASVPVEVGEGDVSGLIPAAAVAALVKSCKRSRPVPVLDCSDAGLVSLEVDGTRQEWRRPDGQWPDSERLIPDEASWSGFRVRLNAKLLRELAEGLGGDDVTLTFVRSSDALEEGEGVGFFPANLRPIIVHNGSAEHGVGILMPIRIP